MMLPAHIDKSELPKYTKYDSRGNGRWVYQRRVMGKLHETRLGDGNLTLEEINKRIEVIENPPIDEDKWAKQLFSNLKKNAKSRNLTVSVTADNIKAALVQTNGKCSISGIKFSEENKNNCRIRPWIPSVDRIDSSQPYTKENIRIVCAAINITLSDWGEETLKTIAHAVLKWQKVV